MSSNPRLKFRHVKKKLQELKISWHPEKGKGSHGAFVGPDQDGNEQSFPLPRKQQNEISNDYFSDLCRRFGLKDKKWIKFFRQK